MSYMQDVRKSTSIEDFRHVWKGGITYHPPRSPEQIANHEQVNKIICGRKRSQDGLRLDEDVLFGSPNNTAFSTEKTLDLRSSKFVLHVMKLGSHSTPCGRRGCGQTLHWRFTSIIRHHRRHRKHRRVQLNLMSPLQMKILGAPDAHNH